MSAPLYKWRVYCEVDSQYEYIWVEGDDTIPVCPTNAAHAITSDRSVIIDSRISDEIKVKEETVATQGLFAETTVMVTALANQITSSHFFWPYDVSILQISYVSEEANRGDVINIWVNKEIISGAIGAAVAPASAWSDQNYTAGQVVTYTLPIYGSRVYTCILDTVSSETPADATYWRHGIAIVVSQTVIDNIKKGFFVTLDDLTNSDDCGRVITIDSTTNTIYMETDPANSYSPVTPTYVKLSVLVSKTDIGAPFIITIGDSKIGGSHVPADTIVTMEYDNKHVSADKTFVGAIEYMY